MKFYCKSITIMLTLLVSKVIVTTTERLVDLSHPFENTTIYWPGTKHFTLTNVVKAVQPDGFWLEANEYEANEHGGTHMDAPVHFSEGRWTIDEVPIDRFISPAVVIDISERAAAFADSEVLLEDVLQWEELHGRIPDGAVMFMNSDWARRYPDQLSYLGNDRGDATDLHFPSWSLEVVQWLTTNRVIHGVGSDTPSAEHGATTTFPVHVHLLGLNLYSLENVNNLNELPPVGATVYTFPMKIYRGSGGPCRIIAVIPDDIEPGNGGSASFKMMFRTVAMTYLFFTLSTYF